MPGSWRCSSAMRGWKQVGGGHHAGRQAHSAGRAVLLARKRPGHGFRALLHPPRPLGNGKRGWRCETSRPVRSNSGVPHCASSSEMCLLSVGCSAPVFRAAPVRLPASSTARKLLTSAQSKRFSSSVMQKCMAGLPGCAIAEWRDLAETEAIPTAHQPVDEHSCCFTTERPDPGRQRPPWLRPGAGLPCGGLVGPRASAA